MCVSPPLSRRHTLRAICLADLAFLMRCCDRVTQAGCDTCHLSVQLSLSPPVVRSLRPASRPLRRSRALRPFSPSHCIPPSVRAYFWTIAIFLFSSLLFFSVPFVSVFCMCVFVLFIFFRIIFYAFVLFVCKAFGYRVNEAS